MSPIHVGQSSSAAMPAVAGNGLSTDSQSLRAVHDRLLEFIAAHSTLSKVTLALADSIVEFYLPEVRARKKKGEQVARFRSIILKGIVNSYVSCFMHGSEMRRAREEELEK